jgi:hypothetical protein
MSVKMKEISVLAEAYDAKLLATDPRFQRSVYLVHEDGTTQFINSAFLMKRSDWIIMFSEHHGFDCYHQLDLIRYEEFQRVPGRLEELANQ